MRPWNTFSAREADLFDYDSLTNALKPDWDLLDRHHWRRDFRERYGQQLADGEIDQHAELAALVLGRHPDTIGATARVAATRLGREAVRDANEYQFDSLPAPSSKLAVERGLSREPNGPIDGLARFDVPTAPDHSPLEQGGSAFGFAPYRVARGGKGFPTPGQTTTLPSQRSAPGQPKSVLPDILPALSSIPAFISQIPTILEELFPSPERPGAGLPAGGSRFRRPARSGRDAGQETLLPKAPGKQPFQWRDDADGGEDDRAHPREVPREPIRPAHPKYQWCMDACKDKADDPEIWYKFCRSLPTADQRRRCWSKSSESQKMCENFCRNDFGEQ